MEDLRAAKGRPARGYGDVGKETIVAAMLHLLRTKPKQANITRKDLADTAKVTPALITYYFQDRENLLSEAVTPVLTKWSEVILQIINSSIDTEVKIRSITRTFVDISVGFGGIYDHFPEILNGDFGLEAKQILRENQSALETFIVACMNEGVLRRNDPYFLVTSLWTLCRMVVQQGATEWAKPENRVDMVLDLFFYGARVR